jgi:hypothetical protein
MRLHGFGQPHARDGYHGKDQGDGHARRGFGRGWEKAGKSGDPQQANKGRYEPSFDVKQRIAQASEQRRGPQKPQVPEAPQPAGFVGCKEKEAQQAHRSSVRSGWFRMVASELVFLCDSTADERDGTAALRARLCTCLSEVPFKLRTDHSVRKTLRCLSQGISRYRTR